jgi:hypothetical protein
MPVIQSLPTPNPDSYTNPSLNAQVPLALRSDTPLPQSTVLSHGYGASISGMRYRP